MIAWWHPDIGITVITAPHLVHCQEDLLSNSSENSRKSGPQSLQRPGPGAAVRCVFVRADLHRCAQNSELPLAVSIIASSWWEVSWS